MTTNGVYVGSCYSCGGAIFDFELCTCPVCGKSVHTGCTSYSGRHGSECCKLCQSQDSVDIERRRNGDSV
jgi:hypothetical protein